MLVEFGGTGSTDGKVAPNVLSKIFLNKNNVIMNNNCPSFKNFCYEGSFDGLFLQDRYELRQIFIVSDKFVKKGKKRLETRNENLKYPTGRKFLLKVKSWLKLKLENIN